MIWAVSKAFLGVKPPTLAVAALASPDALQQRHAVCSRNRSMNAIAFATKRTFHSFLRLTRRPLAAMGLTAARFDMMSAVLTAPEGTTFRGIVQSDLRRALGVTAGVVSRMVRSLEGLGWVSRERCAHDRRQLWVGLTEAGRRCIQEARRALLRAVLRLVFEAICFGRHRSPEARLHAMDQLEGYLGSLRTSFGDAASLYYSWSHPDD
jgi:DNA-binding MarR family transcriptional regulator